MLDAALSVNVRLVSEIVSLNVRLSAHHAAFEALPVEELADSV